MSHLAPGIVLIDKSAGPTSADVVAKVKRHFRAPRVGHAGTLDPAATGLLICLLNGATKLASFGEGGEKCYSGEIRLGVVTSTDDLTGDLIASSEEIPDFAAIEQASAEFIGEISQMPPRVSAVRVGGKRAYHMARQGQEFSLLPRKVRVDQFKLWSISRDTVGFIVRCGPGTYIRSLARDLGEKLGCGGSLAALRREGSHPFSVEQATPLDRLEEAVVLSWTELFPDLERVAVLGGERTELANGSIEALQRVVARRGESRSGRGAYLLYSDAASGEGLGLARFSGVRWEYAANFSGR